jgi:hypothetical protein
MATTTNEETYSGTACIDCAMLIANGEAPCFETEAEEFAWLQNFEARNAGIYWALGDDTDDFSSAPCTTCGSHLGGSRHDGFGWTI